MGPWNQDESGWIFSALVGVIVLVFVGILMSLFIESRTTSGSGGRDLEARVALQVDRIDELSVEQLVLEKQWKARQAFLDHEDQRTDLTTTLADQRAEVSRLKGEVEALQYRIASLKSESGDYRRHYQQFARAKLVGKRFESLELPDGTSYLKVRVTGHDDDGIRIRHSRGGAKIRYANLPTAWKDELQWNPLTPSQRKTTPDTASLESTPDGAEKDTPTPDPDPANDPDEDDLKQQQIEAARQLLVQSRSDYLDYSRAASEARSKSYGSERSVPGSLETWGERAARMGHAATRARTLYHQARAELRRLSPGDPLLRNSSF